MAHRWHFFRAGGVDQVSLRDGQDVLSLSELDQKLWVALAMPVKGVDLDPETLTLIDLDTDGRIRVQDVLAAVAWIKTTFKNPDDILKSSTEVKLTAIADTKVVAAAKHMLKDLGKPDAATISVADATAITKAFSETVLNGDGIVIPASAADDADLKKCIEDGIASVGGVTDRSGKPGLDQAHADELFTAVDTRVAWLTKGKDTALLPLGAATPAAAAALDGVRAKLDDYFTRCRIAAFDPRGATALAGQDAELVALATRSLSSGDPELARLPLAKIDAGARLPLRTGVNPAWASQLTAFVEQTVTPILGARDVLTPTDLAAIADRLAAYESYRKDEPKTKVDGLTAEWLEQLAKPELRGKVKDLIAQDAALSAEYDQITSVTKAVRLQRDFGRLLRNFVNFSDFYSRQDGVFQAGTLYIDARALHLCVPVADAAKHAALAISADAYLVYLDITRKGETRHIAAALTNGDPDNIFIGRNGVFYDRENNDWDATVTKVIGNPISIREAFWSPYKKLAKSIEETVQKRAAAADAEATAHVETAGAAIGHADKAATPTPPPPPPKKIDLGTVAAIGVAIGGVGTLVGALMGTMFGLGMWLPVGVLALMLLISGPAMLLAWLKLRRRNLGPILDANGWAINNRAKINVAFGAAMTELAKLPKGAQRTLDDPFADKKTPWKRWVFLLIILILGGTWYVGKLDKYLPSSIQSVEVLGERAPAYKKPDATPAPAAAATPAPAAPAPAPAK
ncbi:MAG: hypothetical protein IPQ07_18185 [Myxococcales bacterium]|nr:hypothetical protein [Myxococcales bacterium]